MLGSVQVLAAEASQLANLGLTRPRRSARPGLACGSLGLKYFEYTDRGTAEFADKELTETIFTNRVYRHVEYMSEEHKDLLAPAVIFTGLNVLVPIFFTCRACFQYGKIQFASGEEKSSEIYLKKRENLEKSYDFLWVNYRPAVFYHCGIVMLKDVFFPLCGVALPFGFWQSVVGALVLGLYNTWSSNVLPYAKEENNAFEDLLVKVSAVLVFIAGFSFATEDSDKFTYSSEDQGGNTNSNSSDYSESDIISDDGGAGRRQALIWITQIIGIMLPVYSFMVLFWTSVFSGKTNSCRVLPCREVDVAMDSVKLVKHCMQTWPKDQETFKEVLSRMEDGELELLSAAMRKVGKNKNCSNKCWVFNA